MKKRPCTCLAGDAGLHAEQQLLVEAEQAHIQGRRVSVQDLSKFVIDAILLDGGNIKGTIEARPFRFFFHHPGVMGWMISPDTIRSPAAFDSPRI